MGNQQSLSDGAQQPTSSSPPAVRSSDRYVKPRHPSERGPPTSSTLDPTLLAEYQKLRREILDDPVFSSDAILPFENESENNSILHLAGSTPWSKPPPPDLQQQQQLRQRHQQQSYQVPDAAGYYDDSGTTFNDIVDRRHYPVPGPPSPPISASYGTRPKQGHAKTGSGYNPANAPARARSTTKEVHSLPIAGISQEYGHAPGQSSTQNASAAPQLLPGMPVKVHQTDEVVGLVLDDGTPLQLRHAKRQFDRDKFKRANQQPNLVEESSILGNEDSLSSPAPAPSPIKVSVASHDPHAIPLPDSPARPALGLTTHFGSANPPTALSLPPQPRAASATGGLNDMDEALMDAILGSTHC